MSTTAGIPRKWTVADSAETYGVKYWGNNYFSINETGNAVAHPAGPDGGKIDLKELVDEVARRGIGLPLLIRFSDVLRSRIVELNETFKRAIGEYGYKGEYKGVYPIKVNQHRYVVEEIVQFGRPYHYGLEAGADRSHRGREVLRAGAHRRDGQEDGRPPPHRHPGQAGRQGVGALGGL